LALAGRLPLPKEEMIPTGNIIAMIAVGIDKTKLEYYPEYLHPKFPPDSLENPRNRESR
jgi:hypothetical protein